MQPSGSTALLPTAVRNSIFTSLGTVSNFVIGFVFAGLTIRFLGESRAGYLLTLQALIALNMMVGGFGLGTPAIRRIAALHTQNDLLTTRKTMGSILTVNGSLGLLLSLLLLVSFPAIFTMSKLEAVYRSDALWATVLVVTSFFLSQVSMSYQTVYQALQRYDLAVALSSIFGLLSGVLGIIALTVAPAMTTVAAVTFALSVTRLGLDSYYAARLLGGVPWPAWSTSELRLMARFGGWTFLSGLGGVLFTNIDRLVLTSMLGSAALPYYAVPQRLYAQTHAAVVGQMQFFFPMFSAFGSEASAEITRVEDRLRWFVALASGGVYAGMAFIGPLLLNHIVSPEFASRAYLPLVLACLQGFFHAQMIVPFFTSWSMGDGAPNAVTQLVHGALVIATALFLIPRYGYVGASLAQLWISMTAIVHTLWIRHRHTPSRKMWSWLPPYISPLLMILVWTCIVVVGKAVIWESSSMVYLSLVALGGICAMLLVWAFEVKAFPQYQRWATLTRAAIMPIRHMRRGGSK